MANFATILTQIQTASDIVTAAEPAIQLFGTDHVAGTQQLLQIAAAGFSAEVPNPALDTEAVAAAQVAVDLVPVFFKFLSLFHKKTPTVNS